MRAAVLVILACVLLVPSSDAQFGKCGTSRAICTGIFTYRFCQNGVPNGPEQRCGNLLVCNANEGPNKLPCKFLGFGGKK